jgi:hypothetical protein
MTSRRLYWKDVIIHGNKDEAEARIQEQLDYGIGVGFKSEYGKTLLHAAAITNSLPVARLAISLGIPINARAYPRGKNGRSKATIGWTALFYAVRNANYDMVHLLLESGASEIQSSEGETPLQLAKRLQCEDIIWLLVEHGHSSVTTGSTTSPASYPGLLVRMLNSPADLISHLENQILKTFDTDLSQPTSGHCSRCQSLLNSDDQASRNAWEAKKQRLHKYSDIEDPFSYGFLRRCLICRDPLVSLPSRYRVRPGERGVILPSDYSRASLVQKNNCEGMYIISG